MANEDAVDERNGERGAAAGGGARLERKARVFERKDPTPGQKRLLKIAMERKKSWSLRLDDVLSIDDFDFERPPSRELRLAFSGGGREGKARQRIKDPPLVTLFDGDEKVGGVDVILSVSRGKLSNGRQSIMVRTQPDGTAQLGTWELGDPGPHQLTAAATGATARVVIHARP